MDGSADATLANRYALLGLVGEGGMGQVFRARDLLTGQIVAIKRVRWGGSSSQLTLPSQPLTQSLDRANLHADLHTDLHTGLHTGLHTRLRSGLNTSLREYFQASSSVPMAAPTEQQESMMRLALAHEFRTLAGLRHPNIISVLDYGFDDDKRPFFTMEFLEGGRELGAAAAGQSDRAKMQLLCQVLDALHYLHRHGILHREPRDAKSERVSRAWSDRGKPAE
jgi:serine/threonine protein kinase